MTAAYLIATPRSKFFDNNGQPLAYGLVSTYQAGSTTPIGTYTDSTAGTANANPIVLDARGECGIWVPPNIAIKLAVTDALGNAIPGFPVDNIVNSQLTTLYGGVDTGSTNAYILTYTANFSAYADGIVIYWIPSHGNTGASTINVNGLGVVNIVNQAGTAVYAGQIVANQVSIILYKGGQFLLLSVPTAPTVNTQNTNYTFVLADANNIVLHSDSSNYTYTIPSNASVPFAIGTSIEIVNASSTTLTLSPGFSPVQLYPFGQETLLSNSVTLQPSTACYITKIQANVWVQSTITQVSYFINSYTGTVTGMTATISGPVLYRRTGHWVTLLLGSALTGTSNTTALTLTGMPTTIRPGTQTIVPSLNMMDNGTTKGGTATVATSGTVTFALGIDGATAFTNVGQKGLQSGWTISYCAA